MAETPRRAAVRLLVPGDLDAVVRVSDSVGWTNRRLTLEFFVGRGDSAFFVAELDGTIVGCGGATAFGPRPSGTPTGWIHGIAVAPSAQGGGLGTALTQAGIDWLTARGVPTVLLVATEAGLPIYRRLGFQSAGRYASFDWPSELAGEGPRHRLRRASPSDMPAVLELDATATGEDRAAFLTNADATPWVLEIDRGGGWRVEGFHLPCLWGGGPTIARDEASALPLLDLSSRFHRREAARPLAVPEDNHRAIEHLARAGLAPRRHVTRMWLGDDPPVIRAEMIWGVFNFAIA